ncbi:MAG TPA: hypothetical protein VFG21_03990 [Xanthomonadaceae bacterium]|nr:hypothetical protein [Xanthomonadaceae bacterium]
MTVTIEPGSKPEPDRQSCRVRPGSLLTWQPAGSLAHTFEGVEFTDGTPDVQGHTRIKADPAGTSVQIRVRAVQERQGFPYLVWAGGQGHDPEVIVDP